MKAAFDALLPSSRHLPNELDNMIGVRKLLSYGRMRWTRQELNTPRQSQALVDLAIVDTGPAGGYVPEIPGDLMLWRS